MEDHTIWNHPKVGLLILGFLALQFLHSFPCVGKALSKIDMISVNWREVHPCCFESLSMWLPLPLQSEYSLGESDSSLLAPRTSPFIMSFNWETCFSTLFKQERSTTEKGKEVREDIRWSRKKLLKAIKLREHRKGLWKTLISFHQSSITCCRLVRKW